MEECALCPGDGCFGKASFIFSAVMELSCLILARPLGSGWESQDGKKHPFEMEQCKKVLASPVLDDDSKVAKGDGSWSYLQLHLLGNPAEDCGRHRRRSKSSPTVEQGHI